MLDKTIHNLNIPNSCKINKKLFKKQFIENFSLNTNEKKLLSSEVESITLEYLLNKDNINITPYIDEEKDYSEIAYIKVKILSQNKLKQISNIIQNIPYPLIIFYQYKNSTCLNLSPKRISRNDSSKLVVEKNYFTSWIDLEHTTEIEKEFIKNLDIKNQPFTNFLAFYIGYLDKIIAFNASIYSGSLSVNEDTKAILDEIALCETKITELKNKIKKETSFNNKVNMNIELKKIKDNLSNLKSKI